MSQREPWYRDGLCFHCTQCGNCCTGEPGVVWVDDQEIEQIAEHLDKTIGEILLFHTRLDRNRRSLNEYANGDCTFFDAQTRKCRIYPVRPRQCRTWPFWNQNLRSQDAWNRAHQTCPGMNHGKHHDFVQIEVARTKRAP